MARTVLIALAAVLAGTVAAQAQPVCPSGAEAATTTLQTAASSPLYLMVRDHFGPATQCKVDKDADTETLVLSFPHGAALAISHSPAIEADSQELRLAPGATLTRADAVAALRKTETVSAGQDGCGIPESKWRAAARTHGSATLAGDACNCKAAIETKRGVLSLLRFSTAC